MINFKSIFVAFQMFIVISGVNVWDIGTGMTWCLMEETILHSHISLIFVAIIYIPNVPL